MLDQKKYIKIDKQYREMPKGYLFDNGVGLNKTAYVIWDFCKDGKTKQEIQTFMFDQYQPGSAGNKALVENDINRCLTALVENELISAN